MSRGLNKKERAMVAANEDAIKKLRKQVSDIESVADARRLEACVGKCFLHKQPSGTWLYTRVLRRDGHIVEVLCVTHSNPRSALKRAGTGVAWQYGLPRGERISAPAFDKSLRAAHAYVEARLAKS